MRRSHRRYKCVLRRSERKAQLTTTFLYHPNHDFQSPLTTAHINHKALVPPFLISLTSTFCFFSSFLQRPRLVHHFHFPRLFLALPPPFSTFLLFSSISIHPFHHALHRCHRSAQRLSSGGPSSPSSPRCTGRAQIARYTRHSHHTRPAWTRTGPSANPEPESSSWGARATAYTSACCSDTPKSTETAKATDLCWQEAGGVQR